MQEEGKCRSGRGLIGREAGDSEFSHQSKRIVTVVARGVDRRFGRTRAWCRTGPVLAHAGMMLVLVSIAVV